MSDRDAEIARLQKEKEDATTEAAEERETLVAQIEAGGESMEFAKHLQVLKIAYSSWDQADCWPGPLKLNKIRRL